MYIEFALPSAKGGWPVNYNLPLLQWQLEQWAKFYSIPYHTELTHWALELHFEQAKYYTFFAVSWPWMKPSWCVHE